MKVIIVGGVAGGASCAARLRRLDEKAEIVMVERGPYVSYANCGLPYHVGGCHPGGVEPARRDRADVPRRVQRRRADELRGDRDLDPKKKTVDLRDVKTGEVTTESYDKLVLSPGAAPIRPPLPGIDLPGIFSVRTVPDARTIREWLRPRRRGEDRDGLTTRGTRSCTKPKRAVVVGGGFIGLEMVENFAHLGLEVTLVEKMNQVMPPLDPEMARLVERYLVKHEVTLELGDGVAGFRQAADGSLEVLTESGQGAPRRHRRPRDRRASGDGAREGGRARARQARRHPRRRADAHERPRHLRRGRRGRGEGLRHRPVDADPARGAGQPPGPHRRRRDRRPQVALPRHAGHLDLPDLRGRDRPDRRQREGPPADSGTPTSRRSTSTRTRTRATTRARR